MPERDEDTPFRVLAVCVGNLCRSPVAERLLRLHLDRLLGADAPRVAVSSAGVRALADSPMDATSAAELERLGGDARGFAARQLDEPMVRDADLVLALTRDLRSRVLEEVPAALRRTFTLTEFAALVTDADPRCGSPRELVAEAVRRRPIVQVAEYDVRDPVGAPPEVHREVAEVIDASARTVAEAIARAS